MNDGETNLDGDKNSDGDAEGRLREREGKSDDGKGN